MSSTPPFSSTNEAKEIQRTIAFNVRRVRRALRVTDEKLSERTGIPVRTLQEIQSARRNFTVVSLVLIARELDTSLDSFIYVPPTGIPADLGRKAKVVVAGTPT